MPTITTSIDIAAPPAKVRETFLAFDTYPSWAKAHLQTITPKGGKEPAQLVAGDKLDVTLKDAAFSATVEENTASEFRWAGSIPLVFSGSHSFKFEPSVAAPGSTTLVQSEVFGGLLSFLVAPDWSLGKKTHSGFQAFNEELKGRVEAAS